MDTDAIIKRVKRLLFLKSPPETGDVDLDELLKDIVDMTSQRLKSLTGLKEISSDLDYIVVEVSIKRFNRLKNEGMKTYSQEGESIAFDDNDFAEFSTEIKRLANKNLGSTTVKFVNPYGDWW